MKSIDLDRLHNYLHEIGGCDADDDWSKGDSREKAVRRLWMIARIFRGCVSKSAARLVIFLADQDVVIP